MPEKSVLLYHVSMTGAFCLWVKIRFTGIRASESTTSIVLNLPGGINGGLQGSAAGTGVDGTTYVVSGTIDEDGVATAVPFTGKHAA